MGIGKLGLPTIRIYKPSLIEHIYTSELYREFYKALDETSLGKTITKRLDADFRVQEMKGKMLSTGGGAQRFDNASDLAMWWLWRANDIGIEQADHEMESYLSSENIDIDATLWVYGVEPTETFYLADNVQFVQIENMPDSSDKESFLRYSLQIFRHGVAAPSAGFVSSISIPKISSDDAVPNTIEQNLRTEVALKHYVISTLLNCLPGICCIPAYGTAYAAPNVPFGPFGGNGGGAAVYDVLPKRTSRINPDMRDLLSKLYKRFITLPENSKTRLQRALHRLAQAKGRTDHGDRALDLGIALEMLLLNSEHQGQELPGQLNLHFRLRGSWLVGSSAEERRSAYSVLGKIYTLRSQLAHNGISETLNKMDYVERERMLAEHANMAERVIQTLIQKGQPKDWAALILGST